MIYQYFINLNERGEFYADVRNPDGETIFEIKGYDIFEDGFMAFPEDIYGLEKHLEDLNLIKFEDDNLEFGN